jgi:hypothetical protein
VETSITAAMFSESSEGIGLWKLATAWRTLYSHLTVLLMHYSSLKHGGMRGKGDQVITECNDKKRIMVSRNVEIFYSVANNITNIFLYSQAATDLRVYVELSIQG